MAPFFQIGSIRFANKQSRQVNVSTFMKSAHSNNPAFNTEAKFRLLHLLLLVVLLFALWQMPLIDSIHRQVGTRAVFQTVFQYAQDPSNPGWPGNIHEDSAATFEVAERHLNLVNNRSQDNFNTYRTLGVIALIENRLIEAQQWFLQQLETTSNDPITQFFLGETHLRSGNIQAAIEQWEAIGARVLLKKLAQDLVEQKAQTEAIEAFNALIRLDATDVESRRMVADIWLKQDKPEQALPLYQEIFAIDPEDKRAYEEAAKILAKQGDIEQALALSQQIIAIDPESEDGYELSGQILFNAAQYEQAILFLEQTVQLNSADSLTTIMLLGQSYAALNQWPQARQAYEQAIGLDPSNYQLLVLMGEAQCHLQQPAQALFYYQQAIDFGDPSDQTQHAVDYITQQGNCPPKLN